MNKLWSVVLVMLLAVVHVDADATTVEEARDSILAALAQANSPLLNKGGAEK